MSTCYGAYGYVDAEQQRRRMAEHMRWERELAKQQECLAAEHQRQKTAESASKEVFCGDLIPIETETSATCLEPPQKLRNSAQWGRYLGTAIEAKIRLAKYIREHYLSPELVQQTELTAAGQQERVDKAKRTAAEQQELTEKANER